MRTNVSPQFTEKTHEGAPAARANLEQQLRRSVMACLLWEDSFYESGVEIGTRIADLTSKVPLERVAAIAVESREKMKLRHVPLLIAASLLKAKAHGHQVSDLIERICQRADEPAELLALYWKNQPGAPLPKQLKVGLARALRKFDEYQLAKYDRDGAVKLRDVLFLSHANPADTEGMSATKGPAIERAKYKRGDVHRHPGSVFTRIVERKLATPDTWEVALSGGADKRATFERLMAEGKLFGLAFLRNIRNMAEAGVPKETVRAYAELVDLKRVLPFRFISAAAAYPRWEDVIEPLLLKAAGELERLPGPTAVLIDHSGSMEGKVSAKSEVSRFDAAAALAIIVREICDDVAVFTFSDRCIEVPARRGFALRDAIKSVINPVGTLLGAAVKTVYSKFPQCQRLIVITDEQSADRPPAPQGRGYIVNVGVYQNGIAYGPWTHVDGWSEAILEYIRLAERGE